MTSPSPAGPTVGVALPIPEPWGSQLQRARVGYGEGRAHHIPAHITILPPTPVGAGDLRSFLDHLGQVSQDHPPFAVTLRGTGTFRPVSDVVYVQVARGVSSCERLQAAVRQGPLTRELTFPYHPHVTIAHDLPPAALDRAFHELASFTCDFTARSVAVFVHDGDEVWRQVRTVHLRGPAGPGSAAGQPGQATLTPARPIATA